MNAPERPGPRIRLRILLSAYACEPDRGSEPGVGWQWMLALLARGHEVWVLTRANNRERIEAGCARLGLPLGSSLRVLYHDLPAPVLTLKRRGILGTQLYYQLWQRGAVAQAERAHRENPFDLCHHLTFGVWRQPSGLHRLDVPFIFGPVGGGEDAPWSLVRSMAAHDRLRNAARRVLNRVSAWQPALRRCLQRSALILAKTPETAACLAAAGARSELGLEIGIRPDQVCSRPRAAAAQTPLTLLYAGRLVGLKGMHLGIRACELARARGVELRLTIVGQGPERERLERQVREAGLGQQVAFVPWLDRAQLDQRYASHDALIFPSLHDSSGNVVLEAMSHGLPVICLRLGGPGTMVDESNGMAVPAPAGCDAEDAAHGLADAIERLWLQPTLRDRLSLGALRTARAMTWDAAVERAYGRFEQAARATPGRPGAVAALGGSSWNRRAS